MERQSPLVDRGGLTINSDSSSQSPAEGGAVQFRHSSRENGDSSRSTSCVCSSCFESEKGSSWFIGSWIKPEDWLGNVLDYRIDGTLVSDTKDFLAHSKTNTKVQWTLSPGVAHSRLMGPR